MPRKARRAVETEPVFEEPEILARRLEIRKRKLEAEAKILAQLERWISFTERQINYYEALIAKNPLDRRPAVMYDRLGDQLARVVKAVGAGARTGGIDTIPAAQPKLSSDRKEALDQIVERIVSDLPTEELDAFLLKVAELRRQRMSSDLPESALPQMQAAGF